MTEMDFWDTHIVKCGESWHVEKSQQYFLGSLMVCVESATGTGESPRIVNKAISLLHLEARMKEP